MSARQSQPQKVALFDVDKTILQGYSGYYATIRLMREGIVKRRRMAQAIFFKALSLFYKADARYLYRQVLSDMAGCPMEEALELGRQCFEEDLKPRLFREALSRIEYHQEQGHATYFITAGPYMVVKSLGDFLGVSAEYAPRPEVQDGLIRAEIREPFAYLEGKLEVARQIVSREGVDLKDCYFYSDNIDDRILLEAVGNAYAVNPDRKLAALARKRGWPILFFKTTIGKGGSR